MYESSIAEGSADLALQPGPSTPPDRQQVLAELRRKMAAAGGTSTPPVPSSAMSAAAAVVPGHQVRPVRPALAAVCPHGGLPRGGVVGLTGDSGVTSLLYALLAGPDRAWSAVVGMPGLGLLAAAELGVDLATVVLVPDPGPDLLQVLSVLADGIGLIAVSAPPGGLGPAPRLRVLSGKLRQHGTVLLVAGGWPGADLVVSARTLGWHGLGRGHGRLRDRDLEITVTGRGASGRPRHALITLSGARDAVTVVPTAQPEERTATGTTG
jgi:hypothetical protein